MSYGKLGKRPAYPDPRDITLSKLEAAGLTLPKVPASFGFGLLLGDGEAAADIQMNGNGPDDTVQPGFQGAGDCVWACAAHTTRVVNKAAGVDLQITGKESIADYSEFTGYVIGDDNTDGGTDMRAAMKQRQQTGIRDVHGNRHKIGAYVALEAGNYTQLLQAAWIFEAVEIGFQFQAAQYDQFNSGVWDYDPSSQIDGGHAVPFYGHNAKGVGTESWAKHLYCTKAFIENLVDEAYAIVYPDELAAGKNRRGYDLSTLNAYLAEL